MSVVIQTWPAPPPRLRAHGRPYPVRLDSDRRQRNAFMRALRAYGWTVAEIASAYAVSPRTVYYALSESE